jgi:molybdopterin-guanine dinucleotide biosynthesis protein A
VARRRLTGVLLVGGASRRFGSPKALARFGDETLAERGWRTLGEACDERLAVGKAADDLELPFPLVDDACEVRAPLAGLVAGLRAARFEVAVFLPVDTPLVDAMLLRRLGEACLDAAVPSTGPLPGAYARLALPVLTRRLRARELALHAALDELESAIVEAASDALANANTPAELAALAVAADATAVRR